MKKNILIALTSLLLVVSTYTQNQNSFKEIVRYVDPVPGAKYVNPATVIIFKPAILLNETSLLRSNSVKLTGSINGKYSFSVNKPNDENTFIIKPERDFALGEIVTVNFTSGIKTSTGKKIEPFSYSFNIKTVELPVNPLLGFVNEIPDNELDKLINSPQQQPNPDGFPVINVTQSNIPSNGLILLSNIVFNTLIPNTPYLIIMKNDGTPVFSRQMSGQIFNFDRQPNGNFTYFNRVGGKYYEMDSTFTVIDSFYTGNGYLTDIHELRVLPNHHALLMSYDKELVDMSLLVPGGNTNALVTGLIIQEIDENKNVVFQWRSWDHILTTDATHENLLAPEIDYIHGNALESDVDGNILLSSRHLDEITKIDRSSGNTIWRLGGKKNQFTFNNDLQKFSYQHGIRRLLNGHIILFDNGNYHVPSVSRAVEYILDETNHQVTLFWEYRNTPVIFGNAMGFAQRLENGNTLISWGSTNPTLTEVKPDGTKALQVTFATGVFSYRTFKYDWSNGVTGIQPVNTQIPAQYSLSQNYPNPFNPVTKIKFDISGSAVAQIFLSVYDILGHEVAVLVNQQLQPGSYETEWDASVYPSGIYFYRLSTNGFTDTKKMLMIK